MTTAERVILRVLMEEYRAPNAHNEWGPYGRSARRLGMKAFDVAMVEERVVGWPDAPVREAHFQDGDISEYLAGRIEAML